VFFYKISDENIKHDYEINIKKHNKPNIRRRIIPEHFHYGDDDDDDNPPRPPDESLGDNEEDRARDASRSFLSDIYNRTSNNIAREGAQNSARSFLSDIYNRTSNNVAREDAQNSERSYLSDLHSRASSGISEDTPQHAPVKIPKLGPSMSSSSSSQPSHPQARIVEESEPKADISKHENKEESTSDDTKIIIPVDSIHFRYGELEWDHLAYYFRLINEERAKRMLPKIDQPTGSDATSDLNFYRFLKKYCIFKIEADGGLKDIDDNKMVHVIQPSYIDVETGKVSLTRLKYASDLLNDFREKRGLSKLHISEQIMNNRDALYKYLLKYVDFYTIDDRTYIEEESGSGKPLVEIVEQLDPVVPYNDVKNDPYFITK
jgi:hypothetical protein